MPPFLMLAAPLLGRFFPKIGEAAMKWLAPLVLIVGVILLAAAIYFGSVWSFHLIQTSNDDEVKAALNAEWNERVAAGERVARARENTLRGIIESNALLFGQRLADKAAKGQSLTVRIQDEVAKHSYIYGGCIEPDELRQSTRDLVRSIDDPADYRPGDGSVQP